jgi:REP element-mobilizing transposase RayT
LWTNSYFVATISAVDADAVTSYIENQPRRSRK